MTPPPLTIHLFGPLRALVHGEPLPRLRTRSIEWLLAILVLRSGRAVSREWLSGTLWPDSEPGQALKNLRNDLSSLRAALGPEAARIQSPTHGTLTLDLDGAEVDVLRYDRGIAASDENSLREAVKLHAGPLLEGCYEEWALAEREMRASQYVRALERLAEAAMSREDCEEAIKFLKDAELLDPLRDSILRRLMEALDRSGDPGAALEAYRRFRNRLHDEVASEPDSVTTELFREIRTRVRSRVRLVTPHNPKPAHPAPTIPRSELSVSLRRPPHPLTQLIGRDDDIRDIAARVSYSRLVTVVGAGGVGKTRLAIEVSRVLEEDFVHGAVFVELGTLSDPALLHTLLTSSLGLREDEATLDPDFHLSSLVSWLSSHRCLLLLDNCEHLIEAVAELTQTLLGSCPELHILATSRQRLGLTGEVVCRVSSLPFPEDDRTTDSIEEFPAVRLFIERARMAHSAFTVGGMEDAGAIAHICRRLDGIPLAIELAAARVGLMSVGQISARLDDRFRLLTGGSRAALPRHQTLRALIDWSYDQLTDEEKALLGRLSVFVGGWALEAVEEMSVRQGVHVTYTPVLEVLASLVDKSLVVAADSPPGVRYRMLETIREYAAERLIERDEAADARDRHLACYAHLASDLSPNLRGAGPEEAPAVIDREYGNIRAALAWGQADKKAADYSLRLAAAVWPYWEIRGHHSEGREHLRGALETCRTDTPEYAEVLFGAGSLALVQADLAMARELGHRSLSLFRKLNDSRGEAAAMILCGHAAMDSDDNAEARNLLVKAVECSRRCGWDRGEALALTYLGLASFRGGELDLARRQLDEAILVAKACGHAATLALALHNRGFVAREAGDYGCAVPLLEQSLEFWRRLGNGHKASLTLRNLGQICRRQGDLKRALAHFAEAVAVCREQGNRCHLAFLLLEQGGVNYVQSDYGSARLDYAEALELFTACNNPWGVNAARMNLGAVLCHLGEFAKSKDLHLLALEHYRSEESLDGIVWSLERLAVTEIQLGDASRSAVLLGAASKARQLLGRQMDVWDHEDWTSAVNAARQELGEARLDAEWNRGGAMGQDQAIAYALSG